MMAKASSRALVSVLIPTFNDGACVFRAVRSAQEQSHPEVEIVITDNCSTDSTWEILTNLAASDPRVSIARNATNVGPLRNWSEGLTRCTGDFVKILFADDWMEPDFIETGVDALQASPDATLLYSGAVVHSPGRDNALYVRDERLLPVASYVADTLDRADMPYSPSCALLRAQYAGFRSSFGDNSELAEKAVRLGAGPDVLFLLDAAVQSSQVVHIPRYLIHLSYGIDSITRSHNREVHRAYDLAFELFSSGLPQPLASEVAALRRARRRRESARRAWQRARTMVAAVLRRIDR